MQLGEAYEPIAVLGQGSYGAVLRAVDVGHGDEVAVKRLPYGTSWRHVDNGDFFPTEFQFGRRGGGKRYPSVFLQSHPRYAPSL